MPVKSEQPAKPAQLQVNNSGAWKTIARFDAGKADDVRGVENAAELLQAIDRKSVFRIATCDPHPVVLMFLKDLKWSER